MLIAALVVLNVPVFLFIAWLAFDTKESAANTFWETIVALLRIIFIPWQFRMLLGMDDTEAFGIVPIAGFFLACGLIVAGENWLVQRYILGA